MKETEQKSYLDSEKNNTTKYLLPFIYKGIPNYVTKTENGFVNAYTADKDKPDLDNHLFLVYEALLHTVKGIPNILLRVPWLYSKYNLRYNKKAYVVYAMIVNPEYRKDFVEIKTGKLTALNPFAKDKIISFWNGDPTLADVSKRLVYNWDMRPFKDAIPEGDYVASEY